MPRHLDRRTVDGQKSIKKAHVTFSSDELEQFEVGYVILCENFSS